MSQHRLPSREQAAAARRVIDEGAVSVHDLAAVVGATAESLRRWIVEGKNGVHLDGLHRPGVGWMSSELAVARFLTATEENGAG
jgi:hypothetical protein